MRKYLSLTKRNCLVFLRDRPAVFFSLLSMLIVLMLQGVFLGQMNVDEVTNLLKQYGGIRDTVLDAENARHLVQYWTLAGILVVNAVTVTLTVMGVMVSDAVENRLESFYSAPVSKNLIALSYVTTAVVIGTLFCILTLGVSLVYIVCTGGTMLAITSLIQIVLYILMNVLIFAAIMYLAALFVKSSSAWSGIATIVGTLIGFIGAIYLPMGSLPESVANVLKYIPILHGTSLMRKVCCEEMLQTTFADMPAELIAEYKEQMGITVVMQERLVESRFQILFLVVCGMLALAVSTLIVKRKNISDR